MNRTALALTVSVLVSPTLSGIARAEPSRRVAVLLGNNNGGPGRPVLHYAEEDAASVGRVLVELGGFVPADVHVLLGRDLKDVRAELGRVRADIAAAKSAGQSVMLLFYYSGHSDGVAFELNAERWAFADMRDDLKALGADLRVAIVDSCKSGALLTEKGGTPGPSFDIRFTDDLVTKGEAVLTSSAPEEMALESREIHGSFFSHHFVSGLRGAADSSGDGRVTLGEAYRYAFTNTLLATSNTLSGPQHPAFDYKLAGEGELVLTEVLARGATLSLPQGFDRLLVVDEEHRRVVAELLPGPRTESRYPRARTRWKGAAQGIRSRPGSRWPKARIGWSRRRPSARRAVSRLSSRAPNRMTPTRGRPRCRSIPRVSRFAPAAACSMAQPMRCRGPPARGWPCNRRVRADS